jgi:hypothetical protein
MTGKQKPSQRTTATASGERKPRDKKRSAKRTRRRDILPWAFGPVARWGWARVVDEKSAS